MGLLQTLTLTECRVISHCYYSTDSLLNEMTILAPKYILVKQLFFPTRKSTKKASRLTELLTLHPFWNLTPENCLYVNDIRRNAVSTLYFYLKHM